MTGAGSIPCGLFPPELQRTGGAALLLLALWRLPVSALPAYRLCIFRRLTGHACPLCGITHGLLELAKWRWSEALAYNALSPMALVMIVALFWNTPFRSKLWTAGIAAFALYGVVRLCAPGA